MSPRVDISAPVGSRPSRGIQCYSYMVHGAGCRFVCGNDTEIDVDFAADGRGLFDLWRPRRSGLSLPEPLAVTDQGLRAAVRSLQPLLDEVRRREVRAQGMFGKCMGGSRRIIRTRPAVNGT
ncbi:hypothetical protein ACE1OA_34800 [Streptomyces sp. JL2001]|uniref:DUF6896 domain-containing protein n=1 Tax=Streptomyces sp. JL2001 TaxID=3342488 RepID=UPI003D806F63